MQIEEPTYEYVKGQGWVAKTKPRYMTYPEMEDLRRQNLISYDTKCKNCRMRMGSHSIGQNSELKCHTGSYFEYDRP